MSRMTRRRSSRIRCMVIVLAAAAAGACSAPPYYETAADFEDALRAMGVVGEPIAMSTARLVAQGFSCTEPDSRSVTCTRFADNIICGQTQEVTLYNRPDKGTVGKFHVARQFTAPWPAGLTRESPEIVVYKDSGKLPSRCL